jgi:hypothetical protein
LEVPAVSRSTVTRARRQSLVDGIDDRYRLTADGDADGSLGRRRMDCGKVRAPWRRRSFCAISTWPRIGGIFNG